MLPLTDDSTRPDIAITTVYPEKSLRNCSVSGKNTLLSLFGKMSARSINGAFAFVLLKMEHSLGQIDNPR
jgi:hypothetical protein